ncbi:MAG: hypothetical protein NXI24_08200 [bacterium]|nr:hypothetical protein [bacterium]
MSNLSNIGFDVASEEAFMGLIEAVYSRCSEIPVSGGTYLLFEDPSGAELWLQMNAQNECIGANPHFRGTSRRRVRITAPVERHESELDGALHGWANPIEDPNEDPNEDTTEDANEDANEDAGAESGDCPFVFDVPDFFVHAGMVLPRIVDVQLSAFAQDCSYFRDEAEFAAKQDSEPRWASKSFVPTGLFNPGEDEPDPDPPEALALFAGEIVEVHRQTNQFTGVDFYWLLLETFGGAIDAVADLRYFEEEPRPGGILFGDFWLTGRLSDQSV